MWLGKTMSQIKVQDDLQSITNHPDFCIYRIICCYDGNKQKILFHLAKYMYQNRTKSVDLRLPLFGISFKLGHAIKPFSTIMESRFGMEALGSIARLNDLQLKIQKTVPNVPHEPEKIYDATAEHLLRMWAYLGIFVVIETIIAYFLEV